MRRASLQPTPKGGADPTSHLGGRCIGEGHDEQTIHTARPLFVGDQARAAFGQDGGLSAAGRRRHENAAAPGIQRGLL